MYFGALLESALKIVLGIHRIFNLTGSQNFVLVLFQMFIKIKNYSQVYFFDFANILVFS